MPARNPDNELSLATRAAWLHYGGGLSQTDVAKRLSVTKVKAHRLISRANQEGFVKISFDGEIAECASLEMALSEKFGLNYCEVVPDLEEAGLPVRALGIGGARWLTREIANPANKVIGIGNGRTLQSCIRNMASMTTETVKFVSLMGGLTRNFAANPHDVMHRLAEKTGAEAYFMPVPFFANNAQDRQVMLGQRGVPEVMSMAATSNLKFVGIGTVGPSAQTVMAGVLSESTMEDVRNRGGVGELIGHFFDSEGQPVRTELSERTLSVGLDDLHNSRIVAVSGGEEKVNAIQAILKSGLLDGLITDERTAKAIVGH
ncbi:MULTISPECIES: sugar-binding transcriptional regulator [unclassified Roseobacter]|uniref:sugar-binding transcriptional regulator n=1 Tax=unclassified Roseobacter TaxID=196798 RepID=UPI00262B2419|nr:MULTISPECIES: sugar-binding transcriptional regulator [unclassified Roseobacter]MDW3182639.1 sugar-binding transcriptional regulator [Roseobacter sp.]